MRLRPLANTLSLCTANLKGFETTANANGNANIPVFLISLKAGGVGLIQAAAQRRAFKERYPAGFFLGLKPARP
jgi:hypothetical protein